MNKKECCTVQGKGVYVILLAIVAILTLAVAVLTIFLFLSFNAKVASTGTAEETVSESDTGERTVATEELKEIAIYSDAESGNASAPGAGLFNLKATPDHPESYLMLFMAVKIDCGEERKLETERTALVEVEYVKEIRQAATLYFRNLTFDEVSDPAAMQKAADELKDTFNNVLNEQAEEKETIVYKVIFDKWLVQ